MNNKANNILITGGAGYIGSHVAELLAKTKSKIIILDNLVTGFKKLINKKATFVKSDIKNLKKLIKIINYYKIDTVIHLAGLIDVQESEKNKTKYYKNNVLGTLNLLKSCKNTKIRNFIFSSSAGVYGNSKSPVNENSKIRPINYYSKTKLECEKLIKKYALKYNFNYCILRYFNVCGASKSGKIGILNKNNKSLFKIISSQSVKNKPLIKIFGVNYPTKDGTCIRDFIHVNDLAQIHYKCLKYLSNNNKSIILNCGYGKGYSVLSVVKTFQKLIKKKIQILFKDKRDKDIVVSYADNKKLLKLIKWRPKYNDLKIMLSTSIKWEKKISKKNINC